MTAEPPLPGMPDLMHAVFVSDVHLQESRPDTTRAFFGFLRGHARRARCLYLLGDIFEYWAGDDDCAAPFHQSVLRELAAVASAGVQVFWMAGNRDFLVGQEFCRQGHVQLLEEPHIAEFPELGGLRLALVHGDAQCTDDLPYMEFRAKVRQAEWQRQFLGMPLAQRKAIIAGLRKDSQQQQSMKAAAIMDVNQAAVMALFEQTGVRTLIHGHTHRPALHETAADGSPVKSGGLQRYVLPDWECESEPKRGGWIGIDQGGKLRRFGLDGSPA